MMRRKLLLLIFSVLLSTFVFSSIIDSFYQNQPNPSAPATQVFVTINDEVLSLQEARGSLKVGGESGKTCDAENYAIFAYNEKSEPLCDIIFLME